MAVDAIVQDGKILETASESSVKKTTSNSGMDKDAFLQLLVVHLTVCNLLAGRAAAEHGSNHGTVKSIINGRKAC